MTDHQLVAAAANAAWCDAVCRCLGLPTEWTADAWTASQGSPYGYPDAVTLSRGVDPATLLTRVDRTAGCSVKDSFADLDLAPLGFRILFRATWIRCPAAAAIMPLSLDWREARTPAELDQWSRGHDLDVFVPALLNLEDLRFFRVTAELASFALHRTGDVVGVSNTVAGSADLSTVWSDSVTLAAHAFPGRDLVGYEAGADLDAALAVGFVQTGALRVWIR